MQMVSDLQIISDHISFPLSKRIDNCINVKRKGYLGSTVLGIKCVLCTS